jgi:mannose-6-phosphate isomerase-like protein (cupin superfamily)
MELQNCAALRGLRDAVRQCAEGVPGEITKWMTVLLGARTEQGSHIQEHAHPEHTILFYPKATFVEVGGERVDVQAGEVIYIEPSERHGVPEVKSPRLSCAMQTVEA